MIIIYKNDGSIFSKSDSDYIQQGSNDVNKIFVGFVDNAHTTFSCVARFIRANDTETTQMGVTTPFTYNGYNYLGWVFNLTSEETKYAGNLKVFITFYDAFGGIQNTYITNLIINATGYPATGEPTAPITTAEFNSFMAQIAAKQPLQGMTSVVVEQLPASGVVGVLYFLKGSLTGKVYSQYIWNGSAFVWVGSLVLDTFATLEEQRAFEEELREEWQAYYLDLNNQWNAYKQQVDNKVNNALDMTPIPVATVNDLPPQGATQPYVVAEDGYWYYWNGTQWVQGQQYQAVTGYKTLPLGTLNKAYINEIVNNEGSLCYIELEGINAEEIIDNTIQSTFVGYGYAWYDIESGKVLLWLSQSLIEVVIEGNNYYVNNYNTAKRTYYNNENSGLEANNVQDAIVELKGKIIDDNFLEMIKDELYVSSNQTSGSINIVDLRTNKLAGKTVYIVCDDLVEENVDSSNIYLNMYDASYGNRNSIQVGFTNTKSKYYPAIKIPEGMYIFQISYQFNGPANTTKTITGRNLRFLLKENDKTFVPDNKLTDNIVEPRNTTFIEDNLLFELGDISFELAANENKEIRFSFYTLPETDSITIEWDKVIIDSLNTANFNITLNSQTEQVLYYSSSFKDKQKLNIRYNRQSIYKFNMVASSSNHLSEPVTTIIKNVRIYKGNKAGLELDSRIDKNYIDYKKLNLPVLYLYGDTLLMTKENAVDLNYKLELKNRLLQGVANVKWQGTSSLNFPKKNYTIKFDNGFEAKEGWGVQKKYCAKANWVDITHTRNITCARIWADCVKTRTNVETNYPVLLSSPNCGAVDGFPCLIVINDVYQGIYTLNIPKDGWMMSMESSNRREAILCSNANNSWSSRPILGTQFDLEFASDENDTTWIQTALNDMYAAIQSNDLTQISNIIDVESVIDYCIFSILTSNFDGIVNNYILAKYDNSKWFVSAYDLDLTFGNNIGEGFKWDLGPTDFYGAYFFRTIWDLVSDEYKQQRYDILTSDDEGPLSVSVVLNKITEFTKDIPSFLFVEESKVWNTLPYTTIDTIARMIWQYPYRFDKFKKFIP